MLTSGLSGLIETRKMFMKNILVCVGAYFLGCVSIGYYLVRWRCGIDVRTIGSGTTGAFNVARIMKMPGFVITLTGDLLKGVLAMALARAFDLEPFTLMLVMIIVIVGHDFPMQLQFHGGNGLATGTGALLIFDPQLALALAIVFCLSLPVLAILKTVVKLPIQYYTPSKLTVLLMPIMAIVLGREWWEVLGLGIIVAIILWTIRNNMRRLAKLKKITDS
jgi:glycerol-3-phosphate acyltransferase PlsY